MAAFLFLAASNRLVEVIVVVGFSAGEQGHPEAEIYGRMDPGEMG